MDEDFDEMFDFDEANEGSDDYRISPEDFSEIYVIPSDWTVSTLRSEMNDIIDLDPAFQRRSVWSLKAKSKFIESLILGIPIPQILLAENQTKRNHYLVLDGKQRLLTIKEFFEGHLSDGRIFKLSGLEDLRHLNGSDWSMISESFSRDSRSIEGAQIRTAIIRGWQNDNILYEIFHRLNSGSVRLSPMELRMSLIRGPFIADVIEKTSKEDVLQALLNLNAPDKRMRDVEIAIRHMAFSDRRIEYRGNLKDFLDSYCKLRNDDYASGHGNLDDLDELNTAIAAGIDIFDQKHFSRRFLVNQGKFDTRFNRAAFDVLAGSLVDGAVRSIAVAHSAQFQQGWKDICGNQDFLRSIETTTKSTEATRTRFGVWYSKVAEMTGISLPLPNIAQ